MTDAVDMKQKKDKGFFSHPRVKEFLFSFKRFFKNPLTIIGTTIVVIFVLVAIFAPVLAPPENPHDPYQIPHDGWQTAPSPPNAEHPLGTMEQQYDILYGIVWGTRSVFKLSFVIVIANLIVGVILGSLAGYFGGWVDEVIMRITDMFYSLPFLVVAMAMVVAIGRGLQSIMIVMIILGWPQYTRIIRSEIMIIRDKDYILAAKASGAKSFRIIATHILPNAVYSVLIIASMSIGVTVLSAAALSFLGLGAESGYADWGQMVSMCRDWIVGPPDNRLAYWYVVFTPGFVIAMFVLGWNLIGDAARDVFDPKMRRK